MTNTGPPAVRGIKAAGTWLGQPGPSDIQLTKRCGGRCQWLLYCPWRENAVSAVHVQTQPSKYRMVSFTKPVAVCLLSKSRLLTYLTLMMMRTAGGTTTPPLSALWCNMSNAYTSPGHEVRLPYKYTTPLDADASALGYHFSVPHPLSVLEKWTGLRTCYPPWPRARSMTRW